MPSRRLVSSNKKLWLCRNAHGVRRTGASGRDDYRCSRTTRPASTAQGVGEPGQIRSLISRVDAFALTLRGRQQEGTVGGTAAKGGANRMVDLLGCEGRRQKAGKAHNAHHPKSN